MTPHRSFKQELVGVFGEPVDENPTQAMMEAAFRGLGLNWRYLTVEVAPPALGDAVRGARAMNWRGFNCTIPHKIAVIRHLDRLSFAAEAIGAVNCVVHDGGGMFVGENTDGKGFLEAVRAVRAVKGTSVVVLGAGGAARAIAVELGLAGAARLTIVNRTLSRAESLVQALQRRTSAQAVPVEWTGRYRIPEGTDILVNATSIGLYPAVDAEVPIDPETLDSKTLVCDVIPNPPRTRLIRDAEARGCRVLDGLEMLVRQGVIGLRLWSGLEPDPKVMRDALTEVFGT